MALEIFSNNSQTTLNGAINAVQVHITVNPPNPGYPFPTTGNFRILIDNEIMLVTGVAGLVWTVVRGVEAATTPAAVAAPHANGALVSQIETSAGIIQAILDRVDWVVSAGTTSNDVTAFATVVFSNSNNVSFGLNGSTITASAGAAAGSVNFSAGTTSNNLTAITFADANGISFGLNGSTMTASYVPGVGTINISAGTTSNNLTAVTFSNSNGVSFGLNGSTVTASIATSLSAINVSAGTTSNNLSAITLSNSNNLSFGLNGSTLTASAPVNFSAGTTSQNLTAITFGDSNGISFGLDGSTITGSVAGTVGTISCFSQDADFVTGFTASQAALSLQKLSLPMNLLATELALIANFAGNSASSGAVTVSHAVYTLSGGTASLASSASAAFSWTSGSATGVSSQFGGASGTRYRTMSVSYAMTPGDYLFAWALSTAGGATVAVFGRAGLNIVGTYGGIENDYFLNGLSASTVTGPPVSIAASDTGYVRTGFSAMLQPGVILVGTH